MPSPEPSLLTYWSKQLHVPRRRSQLPCPLHSMSSVVPCRTSPDVTVAPPPERYVASPVMRGRLPVWCVNSTVTVLVPPFVHKDTPLENVKVTSSIDAKSSSAVSVSNAVASNAIDAVV